MVTGSLYRRDKRRVTGAESLIPTALQWGQVHLRHASDYQFRTQRFFPTPAPAVARADTCRYCVAPRIPLCRPAVARHRVARRIPRCPVRARAGRVVTVLLGFLADDRAERDLPRRFTRPAVVVRAPGA